LSPSITAVVLLSSPRFSVAASEVGVEKPSCGEERLRKVETNR
jgi:hypothetical protein